MIMKASEATVSTETVEAEVMFKRLKREVKRHKADAEKNCWTCANRHLGWNDDWIDMDYHDWVCDRNTMETFLLDSNKYSEKKCEAMLKKMGLDCKDWKSRK